MKKRGYILAIDQGTTGSRVILFDHDGTVHSMAYRELRQIYPHPGWVEHDPLEIWEGVRACIQEALSAGKVEPREVLGIGITNQRESTILWEKDSGKPLYNSICWQCRRSAAICDRLKADGHEPAVMEKTGLVIDAYFSATKIKWIMDNVPEVRRQIERGNVCMGNIDSWLIWNLTEGRAHVTDFSNASRTMLLNIHKLAWDPQLLGWLGIPEKILPRLLPSSGEMARTSAKVFYGQQVPIAGDAGDQHAATFGQACFRPGMAKNSYGTALAVFMNTGTTPARSKSGLTTDLGWRIRDKVEYALEGVIFIGGAAIEWLKSGLGIIEDAAQATALAEKVPDTGGVYLVPAFTGLCAPYWDMYARGLIIGITRGTGIEHIARAALESIAYQTRDVVECMEKDSGIKLKELRVDGGAAANIFLMQFQADILGVPVVIQETTETTALGAAYLAGLAIGFWKDTQQVGRNFKVQKKFIPRMPVKQRESLYRKWKKAVERARGWEEE
jgi:glycerol kinase